MKRAVILFLCLLVALPSLALSESDAGSEAVPERLAQDWANTGDILTEGFPALTEEGFLPEGEKEFVLIDEAQGIWRYASQSLRIVIRRTESRETARKQRCLIADIFLREGSGGFRMVAHNPDHKMENLSRYMEKPSVISINHKIPFSMGGDHYIYRVRRRQNTGSKYNVGVVIRDGEILMDAPAKLGSTAYPPLDMLAMFDDGDMQVYKAGELSAQQLIDAGARDVLSFGPVLVRDGELGIFDEVRGATPQPRAGIGMYAPGHYLAIIAEGRIKESAGLSSKEFGELFLSLGCPTAFNLDGGWTSSMVFMGKQLNQLNASGVRNNARNQNEIMGIGYTELMKQETDSQ